MLETARRSAIPVAVAVSSVGRYSVGFVGLDSELDEDSMPLFLVLLLSKIAGSMALGE
ncbi:MAG TPA: hypothetical protein VLT15_01645 [Acidimicrobiia bacterium]|nr:hypothetical protein [Acidimicrobiia bacterium]